MLDAMFGQQALFFTVPALLGTVVFVARLIMMSLGGGDAGGHDGDLAHTGDSADSTHAFNLLSVQSIAAFLMGFGWGGLGGLIGFEWPMPASLLTGAGLGALFAVRSRTPKIAPDVLKAPTVETVVAPTGVQSAAGSMLGRFTILNGSRAGEKLGLGGSGIRIGRESTICEIVLENPKVSRLHAEVVSIDGKVLLIDRNSSNGTYVNDHKIDKRFLEDGDIIYFGGRNAVAVAFHA